MNYLPISLNVKHKPCLVVGITEIVKRKVTILKRAGAKIDLILSAPDDGVLSMIEDTGGQCLESYSASLLDNYTLVVVASLDNHLVTQVSRDAVLAKVPVNVYQRPELSTFTFPYVIDRDPLSIAVSSAGMSSAMTRLIKGRINALIPHSFGKLAGFFKKLQPEVNRRLKDRSARRRFWESVIDGPVAEHIYKGQESEAKNSFLAKLGQTETQAQGEVYLIGAGPGDPDLLTFKALRLLQSADIVLYDRLVNEALLDFARPDAEKFYVGKAKSNHSVPQDDINQLLKTQALEGKRVARLKGGDPFIFGRGGEEIDGLAAAGIPFQVIPGITAANGCSAYAGIPLTHRDYAQSVRFITGHLKEGALDIDWKSLVAPDQTVVFYMGFSNLSLICQQLINFGRSPETPVALIENGTSFKQRIFISTLQTLPDKIKQVVISGPALTIVGEVVQLHDQLDWFTAAN